MAQRMETMRLQIHHGHTETQVAVEFNQPVKNLLLTEEEAEAHIKATIDALAKLRAYKAKGKN